MESQPVTSAERPHLVSVVVPVYQGETTLEALVSELDALTSEQVSADGHVYRVVEVILVSDRGPDNSSRVMRHLAATHPYVRPTWLSRNFGQHAATLAGMASSGGDWIVTLDEDGQHDPRYIGAMLDVAIARQVSIVYAKSINVAPHGFVRNITSKGAKRVLSVLSGSSSDDFQSYRLILGEVGRSVAAYAGSNVYLDVALSWVAGKAATAPVALREEGGRRSGYSTRRLFSHFWRMILTSGTRGLRLVTAIGIAFAIIGVGLSIWVVASRVIGHDVPEGWASTVIVILFSSGAILFALGVIAEYIGVAVNMALGKPSYLLVNDPANGPLGRTPVARS